MAQRNTTATSLSRGARNQQVAQAGKYFVVAEMNKRGVHAVIFAGNMPKIDLIACDQGQSRTVHIQVKTKRGGRSWHASTLAGEPTQPPTTPLNETSFWVFVDLGDWDGAPCYWVVPDWWMRNDIYRAHQAYLDSHGGRRARNPDSTHHAIDEQRLEEWRGNWEILGIF
ncbi:MAG: hypothetical protein KGS73_13220 [Chloroflexi bacterium]|jgi:hypothetical protein|nr:hypothetical protein [Chloroflexota bacterium]